jgi:hypothetical protein
VRPRSRIHRPERRLIRQVIAQKRNRPTSAIFLHKRLNRPTLVAPRSQFQTRFEFKQRQSIQLRQWLK